MFSAVLFMVRGIKCARLEILSTISISAAYPSRDLGSLNKNSIAISFHFFCGGEKALTHPYLFLFLDLYSLRLVGESIIL